MKFIGKFVSLFDAIFKKDVTLGTIASGGNLGLDSNNKIVKNTVGGTTDLTSDVTGTLPVANGGTGATTLAANSILTGNGTSAIQAESGLQYNDSTSKLTTDGDFELTGVIQLGNSTDTTIARSSAGTVTIEGNQIVTKADFSYQYISFSFSLTLVADSWHTPSQHGIDNHTWSNTHKVGGTQEASDNPPDVDSETTIDIDYLDMPSCIAIPKACKLVGFYGQSRLHGLNTNDARPVFGLFRAAEPADRSNSDLTATVVAFDSYDTTAAGNNMQNRFLKLNADVDVDLAAGDLIYPAFGVDKTGITGSGFGSYTVVLKTLIP